METETIDQRKIRGIRAMFDIPETSDIVPLSEKYCNVGQEVFTLNDRCMIIEDGKN